MPGKYSSAFAFEKDRVVVDLLMFPLHTCFEKFQNSFLYESSWCAVVFSAFLRSDLFFRKDTALTADRKFLLSSSVPRLLNAFRRSMFFFLRASARVFGSCSTYACELLSWTKSGCEAKYSKTVSLKDSAASCGVTKKLQF